MLVNDHIEYVEKLLHGEYEIVHDGKDLVRFKKFRDKDSEGFFLTEIDITVKEFREDIDHTIMLLENKNIVYLDDVKRIRELLSPLLERKAKIDKVLKEIDN